jgi:predicted 2-oxoglutarate/Fe(II)-dependent dioxygenase YbiX
MKNIQDYIVVIKNALTDPLCEAILNEYKDSDQWTDAVVGNGGKINKDVRNCKTIGISQPIIIETNKKIRQKLDKYMFASAGVCIKKYNNKFQDCKIEEDSGYELLKYDEGGYYSTHTDSFKARPRAISCSFILNDDYEGGEFAFFDRELKYKLEKGDALMFPSNFMYPHEVMPVTKGTRYSVITWFI